MINSFIIIFKAVKKLWMRVNLIEQNSTVTLIYSNLYFIDLFKFCII